MILVHFPITDFTTGRSFVSGIRTIKTQLRFPVALAATIRLEQPDVLSCYFITQFQASVTLRLLSESSLSYPAKFFFVNSKNVKKKNKNQNKQMKSVDNIIKSYKIIKIVQHEIMLPNI